MNKKVFNTILLFTGSVLTGIIVLQVLWLNNLAAIRKQELHSNTQQALTSTAAKLQTREHVSMIMENFNHFIPDSVNLQRFHRLSDLENMHRTSLFEMVAADSVHGLTDIQFS